MSNVWLQLISHCTNKVLLSKNSCSYCIMLTSHNWLTQPPPTNGWLCETLLSDCLTTVVMLFSRSKQIVKWVKYRNDRYYKLFLKTSFQGSLWSFWPLVEHTHTPASCFTLSHWYTGTKVPRNLAMCQQRQIRRNRLQASEHEYKQWWLKIH